MYDILSEPALDCPYSRHVKKSFSKENAIYIYIYIRGFDMKPTMCLNSMGFYLENVRAHVCRRIAWVGKEVHNTCVNNVNIISTKHIKRMSSLIPCLHNLFCIFIQERRDLWVGFRLACLPSFNIMIFCVNMWTHCNQIWICAPIVTISEYVHPL